MQQEGGGRASTCIEAGASSNNIEVSNSSPTTTLFYKRTWTHKNRRKNHERKNVPALKTKQQVDVIVLVPNFLLAFPLFFYRQCHFSLS
jgi:hypothetical protein